MTPQELDLGAGMVVRLVDIAGLKEQDINAQVMQPADLNRLTENIKQRGQVESLPYCYQPGGQGRIEIVSGHHRVRAARAAGLTQIPVIIDTVEMPTSTKIAKQIAHNQLHGEADQQILAQLVAMIDDVDDLILTGLPDDWMPVPPTADTSMQVPHADFDWHSLTLMFLPQQMDEFRSAIMSIEAGSHVAVARADQYEAFAKACHEFSRFSSIVSATTAVSVMTDVALAEVEHLREAGVPPRGAWTRTGQLVGHALPPELAKPVKTAIDRVVQHTGKTPAEALAAICEAFMDDVEARDATEPLTA